MVLEAGHWLPGVCQGEPLLPLINYRTLVWAGRVWLQSNEHISHRLRKSPQYYSTFAEIGVIYLIILSVVIISNITNMMKLYKTDYY